MKITGPKTLALTAITFLAMGGCSSAPRMEVHTDARSEAKDAFPSKPGHQVLPITLSNSHGAQSSLQVHRFDFENGLRLLVIEDHTSPTFAYQTWFRVGSRNEVPTRTGLAHLFEHMMFKATKNFKEGEFDRILEEEGAMGLNAFTSQDYTAYVQELPKDSLETLVKLESDRMVNLVVDEAAFKTEREVVQNERRFRTENSPDGTLNQELYELAFSKHPYHWPVIGYKEDLENMSYTDASNFYRRYYKPASATIIISGDVDPNQTYEMIKKYYGGLQNQTVAETSGPVEDLTLIRETPPKSPQRKTLKLNLQNEKILVSYPGPDIRSEDLPALNFISGILSAGKSSRLEKALVDSGLAQGVYASPPDAADPGIFVIGASLQRGKKATHLEGVLLAELERLKKEPISKREMEKVKNLMQFDFYEALNSNSERCRYLGEFESITRDFRFGMDLFRRTMEVTPEQVQLAAQKYFDPSTRTILVGVPK